MNTRILLPFVCLVLLSAVTASSSVGYIHFPPMTLQKMCKQSMCIRVIGVKKHDKEKGVVVYETVENLKGECPRGTTLKHALGTDADRLKPIHDWLADGKRAVMFTIETGGISCGYVFIDEYCYSVDHNRTGDFWLLIRTDPEMSSCYYGSAEELRKETKDILADKEVKVPVNELAAPVPNKEREKRVPALNEILNKNRGK